MAWGAHARAHDHPLVGGNQRTGLLALGLWLAGDGVQLEVDRDDAGPAFVRVATDQADWTDQHSRPTPGHSPLGS